MQLPSYSPNAHLKPGLKCLRQTHWDSDSTGPRKTNALRVFQSWRLAHKLAQGHAARVGDRHNPVRNARALLPEAEDGQVPSHPDPGSPTPSSKEGAATVRPPRAEQLPQFPLRKAATQPSYRPGSPFAHPSGALPAAVLSAPTPTREPGGRP